MKKMLALIFGLMLVCASSASAVIVVDNWDIDLSGVDGAPDGWVVKGIKEIGFTGTVHNVSPNFSPSPNIGYVDGLLYALGFEGASGAVFDYDLNQAFGPQNPGGPPGGQAGWQMTFDFSVDVLNQGNDPAGFDFNHIAASEGIYTDGFMDIYIDYYDGTSDGANPGPTGYTLANKDSGLGFQDGTWVARFAVTGAEGGTWTSDTFDGSDDAQFVLVDSLDGVFWLDYDGGVAMPEDLTIAITDSNLDADPLFGESFALGVDYATDLATDWPFANKIAGQPYAFFAQEDGSARLAIVPEPSTFLLLGAGLFGLFFCARKRKQN